MGPMTGDTSFIMNLDSLMLILVGNLTNSVVREITIDNQCITDPLDERN